MPYINVYSHKVGDEWVRSPRHHYVVPVNSNEQFNDTLYNVDEPSEDVKEWKKRMNDRFKALTKLNRGKFSKSQYVKKCDKKSL